MMKNKEIQEMGGVPKITYFVKTRGIQSYGHMMKGPKSANVRVVEIQWRPYGKISN